MQIINEVWSVPDGDELITRKICECKKPNSNHKDIDLYYERRVRDKAMAYVRNYNTFIDIGANVGIWTRPMASLFKNVHSFEPAPKNLECLRKNLHDTPNVDIYTYGLSDINGVGFLVDNVKNCGDCSITYQTRLKRKIFGPDDVVEVKTLDSHELEDVGLIKIDTQGHELRILKGSVETLQKSKPVVVFEINDDKDRCCDLLESLGAERVILRSKCLMLYAWK